eukprot:scaffold1192_cov83-Skeletonema_dohrnii-CCMP3373.AAC.1
MNLALNTSMLGVNGKEILYVLKTLLVAWNSFRLICRRQKPAASCFGFLEAKAGKERRKRPESYNECREGEGSSAPHRARFDRTSTVGLVTSNLDLIRSPTTM